MPSGVGRVGLRLRLCLLLQSQRHEESEHGERDANRFAGARHGSSEFPEF
jgi:hypothetical protein